MNEEFAIKLKMVMDNSSIAQIKEQMKTVEKIGEDIHIPAPHATEMFDVENLENASAEISYLLYQIKILSEDVTAMREHPELWDEGKILKAEAELQKLIDKYNKLQQKQEETKETVVAIQETSVQVNNNFGKSVKQIMRMGLALLGVRGVYGSIRKAMSTYLAQNVELQQKINSCWYALGSLFAPVVEWLVNLFAKLVSLIDSVVKLLGGAGISMKNFGKQAGKASKQLAGFDELNNLTENGGGGGFANPFGNFELADKFGEFASLIKGNIAVLELMGIGAMFGIGVAFLFSGHPLIGLGMILSAGVLTYQQIVPNWNYLVEKVGGVKNAIMAILAGFTMGLGAVLLFTGNPALGLGLLMTGLAVASAVIDWSYLPNNILETVTKIMGIIAIASTAIGFILMLVGAGTGNWGLFGGGIGLLVGGLGLGMTATKLNTTFLSEKAGESLDNVQSQIDSKLPVIESSMASGWGTIEGNTKYNWGAMQKDVSGALSGMNGDSRSKTGSILSIFNSFNSSMTSGTTKTWTTIGGLVMNKIDDLRQKLGLKWNGISQWWQGLSLGSFKIPMPHFSIGTSALGLPKINVDWYAKGGLFSGPQVIGVGEYGGASNNPEVVAPLNTLEDYMDNDETNDLLRELINVVGSKEFKAYISQREVGESAVKYINSQSRIMGGSIV